MSKKAEAEVVREVTTRIDAAIAANRRQEWTVIIALLALFLVGLALLVLRCHDSSVAVVRPRWPTPNSNRISDTAVDRSARRK
jgi:hypothetical protein